MENILFDDGVDALTTIISCLKKLSREEQQRTLQAVATFLDISLPGIQAHKEKDHQPSGEKTSRPHVAIYTEDRTISAKDFMRDKSPRTDVERVASLAYFLTHYRDVPHFKTLDISTLNTEAAQPKFSNASVALDNAARAGLLVPAVKGSKQLSGAGERYVQLLPDRDAAKASMQSTRKKRARKSSTKKSMRKKSVT